MKFQQDLLRRLKPVPFRAAVDVRVKHLSEWRTEAGNFSGLQQWECGDAELGGCVRYERDLFFSGIDGHRAMGQSVGCSVFCSPCGELAGFHA